MAIQHWDPMRELSELQRKMNRLFDETFCRSSGPDAETVHTGWKPSTDLFEEDDRYILQADLPGVAAEDVDVQVEDGMLVLRGERRRGAQISREAYLRLERPYGRFALQIALSPSVDAQSIRATQRDGVLEVELPKKRAPRPNAIEVAR